MIVDIWLMACLGSDCSPVLYVFLSDKSVDVLQAVACHAGLTRPTPQRVAVDASSSSLGTLSFPGESSGQGWN